MADEQSENTPLEPESGSGGVSWLHRFTALQSGLGTIGILVLIVLINTDVIGRYVFNSPLKGVPEVVSLAIVGIVYLQISHAIRQDRFIRSDMFISRLLVSRPRAAHLLLCFHHLVGALLVGVVFYFVFPKFIEAYKTDEYIGSFGYFTAPIWPVGLVILIGCGTSVVQFALIAFQDFMKAVNGSQKAGSQNDG